MSDVPAWVPWFYGGWIVAFAVLCWFTRGHYKK